VHPSHSQDAAEAVAWLRNPSQYETFHYDSNNVFLFGHSCGAHMSAMLSLAHSRFFSLSEGEPNWLRGCIGIQGMYDLRQIIKDFPSYLNDVQRAFSRDETNWDSPQFLGEKKEGAYFPSWMVIHSPDDDWVNDVQARNFAKHLQDLGIDVVLDERVRGDHMRVVFNIGATTDLVAPRVLEFIASHIK